MNIVVLDGATVTNGDISFDALKDFGNLTVYDLTAPEEILTRLSDAKAVLVNKTVLSEDTLKMLPNLKYIGLFATGYNNIDVKYAHNNGITVCNAGVYSTDAVAQQVFSYILNHTCKTDSYDSFVKNGGWKRSERFSPFIFETHELSQKTIGIVGYGNIGKRVAEIAKAFKMRVIVYTRTKRQGENVEFVTLDELLKNSDYVTVHCPLTEETENMFNLDTFKKFKKDAYFINTSRGAVVNEDDLVYALNNKLIAGAAIDVLKTEPMKKECMLLNCDNITITPHTAWSPIETRRRLMEIVYDNIRAYLDGTPINTV